MPEWYNRTNSLKTIGGAVTPPMGRTAKAQWRRFDMNILSSKISGVYKIVNTINGNCYIGSAVNIRNRWIEHKGDLRHCQHHSPHLQNAWNKYGESCFTFSILEYCDKSLLIQCEQFYIDLLHPEYNISLYARSPMLGRKHNQKSKDQTSSTEK
jgi:group I intron endonuclease